jgi:hypothetical protein
MLVRQVNGLIQDMDRFAAQFGHRMFYTNQFMEYRSVPPNVQVCALPVFVRSLACCCLLVSLPSLARTRAAHFTM